MWFPCFEVWFAPPSKPVTIGSGKSHAVPDPVRWKGNGVRLNRVFYTPVEAVDRPLVGYAKNYPANLFAEAHSHPKAQLIYAVSGVMHVETASSSYIIPPSTALVMPADLMHTIYMDGSVAMRTLFLKQSVAPVTFSKCKVITVTPLLRELILAACSQPLEWDIAGRGNHIAALALDEIEKSSFLPLEIPLPSVTEFVEWLTDCWLNLLTQEVSKTGPILQVRQIERLHGFFGKRLA